MNRENRPPEELTPQYQTFHDAVVDAAVHLSSEDMREFFDSLSFYDYLKEGVCPEDAAQNEIEAMQ